ncbi:uncharacterized protein LOC134707159 [Mytilus trossulus]|uniref:uncharacterized protein LOC134707159 n=1 Tax=Mytilus trossulus TaxID=6551 RepID=UPI00300599AA
MTSHTTDKIGDVPSKAKDKKLECIRDENRKFDKERCPNKTQSVIIPTKHSVIQVTTVAKEDDDDDLCIMRIKRSCTDNTFNRPQIGDGSVCVRDGCKNVGRSETNGQCLDCFTSDIQKRRHGKFIPD